MSFLNRDDCYRYVLQGAVNSDYAAGGVWFGLSPDKRAFHIETHTAITPAMLAYAATLRPGDGSATGTAVLEHHRVVIRDIEVDCDGNHRAGALAAGIRAVTVTPLIDSRFHAVGVIALYHTTPHHPSYSATQHLDGCCRVGAKLHEVFEQYGGHTLSPVGRRAVEAVMRLLPAAPRSSSI